MINSSDFVAPCSCYCFLLLIKTSYSVKLHRWLVSLTDTFRYRCCENHDKLNPTYHECKLNGSFSGLLFLHWKMIIEGFRQWKLFYCSSIKEGGERKNDVNLNFDIKYFKITKSWEIITLKFFLCLQNLLTNHTIHPTRICEWWFLPSVKTANFYQPQK